MRQPSAKEVQTAPRPATLAIRSPPLVAASVVEKTLRGVPMADLAAVAAVLHVASPLVASIGTVRVRAAPSYEPAVAMATPIMARAYEVAKGRSPLIPTAILATGFAFRVAVARMAASRPDAGAFPVPSA